MRRDRASLRERLMAEPKCRLCGMSAIAGATLDPHHVVPRSVTQCDEDENIVPLCRRCHEGVEMREVDLLSVLTLEEQGHAATLVGIERAHRLLAPSVYKRDYGERLSSWPSHEAFERDLARNKAIREAEDAA